MAENQTSVAKRVPIRIVHSEGVTEKESCPFLQPSEPPAGEPGALGVTKFSSLGAAGQDSGFCAFTRQREEDGAPRSQTDTKPQSRTYSSPVRDHTGSSFQKAPQSSDGSGSDAAEAPTRLSEDQKREELAKDIMGKDKSLADILDQSKMKTTMDLMQGIFPQEEQLLEGAQQRKKVLPKQTAPRPAEERSGCKLYLDITSLHHFSSSTMTHDFPSLTRRISYSNIQDYFSFSNSCFTFTNVMGIKAC